MYSDSELREAVTSGRARLSYKFMPSEGGVWKPGPVRFGHEDANARQLFEAQITRSRVGLHLGCLIRPLTSSRRVRPKQRFGRHKGIIDLRKCGDDGWLLPPSASAVVFTNEWIELPHDTEAFVASRVGDYNAGLIVAGSYIDSTWRGLTKLHVTNSSRRAIKLYTGLEIGRLFLFRTAGETTDSHGVTTNSGHYEKSWDDILQVDTTDPFFQREVPLNRFSLARVRNFNELIEDYAGVPLVAAMLAAGLALWRAGENVADSSTLKDQIERLEAAAPISGAVTITIPAGEVEGAARVVVGTDGRVRGAESFHDAERFDGGSDGVVTSLAFGTGDEVTLEIRVSEPTAVAAERDVDVRYVVVP